MEDTPEEDVEQLEDDIQETTDSKPELLYCRKCQKHKVPGQFRKSTDGGMIDSNGKMSICKSCLIKIYDELFVEFKTPEATIHKMCQALNVKYTNEAMDATKKHIESLAGLGQQVSSVFSIYLLKLVATIPGMDKSVYHDMTYSDIGTIYVDRLFDAKEASIPKEVVERWDEDITSVKLTREDILFLEREFNNFKNTHSANTYAEVVLLKRICRTLLALRKAENAEAVDYKEITAITKTLQDLMNNSALSPKSIIGSQDNKDDDTFGNWIRDIERYEPAEWMDTDERGKMFRDVANTEQYFQDYLVRPLKNFITESREFNIEDAFGSETMTALGAKDDK